MLVNMGTDPDHANNEIGMIMTGSELRHLFVSERWVFLGRKTMHKQNLMYEYRFLMK